MQTTYAKLLFQTDGNLVLYKRNPFGTSLGDTGVWASHTSGVGYRFTIDGSGHIVIFNRSNEMVWMANLELGVPPGLSFDASQGSPRTVPWSRGTRGSPCGASTAGSVFRRTSSASRQAIRQRRGVNRRRLSRREVVVSLPSRPAPSTTSAVTSKSTRSVASIAGDAASTGRIVR